MGEGQQRTKPLLGHLALFHGGTGKRSTNSSIVAPLFSISHGTIETKRSSLSVALSITTLMSILKIFLNVQLVSAEENLVRVFLHDPARGEPD